MPRDLALGKLLRPQAQGLIAREPLFERLDGALRGRAAWITAPAGAGKTALLSAWLESRGLHGLWYHLEADDRDPAAFFARLVQASEPLVGTRILQPALTPDALAGLERYARRLFESLVDALPRPCVLVLDNFHALDGVDAPLRAMDVLLGLLPAGALLVVAGREPPPASLSRRLDEARLQTLGWDELRFSALEVASLAEAHGVDPPAPDALPGAAGGWAAALVLLLRGARNGGSERDRGQLFDELAAQVLSKEDEELRTFLLRTAPLPWMTRRLAEQQSGDPRAGEHLERLSRAHFFVERRGDCGDPVFHTHPLLQGFLNRQLGEARSAAEVAALRRQAADLLAGHGHEAAAVELYSELDDPDALAGLIQTRAPRLLAGGRHRQLEQWLDRLPEPARDASPWPRYWRGQARLPFDPEAGRGELIAAYHLFTAAEDLTGQLLAITGILQSHYLQWGSFVPIDGWIEILERHGETIDRLPGALQAELIAGAGPALHKRQPEHPLAARWYVQAQSLARAEGPAGQRLVLASFALAHAIWRGAFREAAAVEAEFAPLAERLELPAAVRLRWRVLTAFLCWLVGRYGECLGEVESGLRLARDSGIHGMDFLLQAQAFYAVLGQGDHEAAAHYLRGMQGSLDPQRLVDVHHLHFMRGCLRVLGGDCAGVDAVGASLAALEALGNRALNDALRVEYAQMLALCGRYAPARRELAAALARVRRMDSRLLEYQCYLLEAYVRLQEGRRDLARRALERGLEIAVVEGYNDFHPYWHPPMMTRLYSAALRLGIQTDFVRAIVRQRGLTPVDRDLDAWPWAVRIHTLGGFRVEIDDVPLEATGKPQRKPLEVLKALIAHGGHAVSTQLLTEQLWPDAEADTARRSFETTLHRLRRLLGNPRAIRLAEGKLSLNPDLCWLDLWNCEAHIERCGSLLARRDCPEDELKEMAECLLRTYRGPFMHGEEESPWILITRQRLALRFERLVLRLGRRLEPVDAELAEHVYRQALEFDLLNEAYYQGLMRVLLVQGRRAEAMASYRRCQEVLSHSLGTAPSAETRALLREIRSG